MIKRPKPGESEEDILRMQEDYLKNKSINKEFQPSAQVVNLRRTEHQTIKRSKASPSVVRKPSKYALSKGLRNTSEKLVQNDDSAPSLVGEVLEKNTDETQDHVEEPDNDKVYFPRTIPSVIGEIIEKNLDIEVNLELKPLPSQGFPLITKRDPALGLSAKYIVSHETLMDIDVTSSNLTSKQKDLNLPKQSFLLTHKDADTIHDENVKILSNMSEREILEEKKKLLYSLDPKLIEYMQTKRKKTEIEMEKLHKVEIEREPIDYEESTPDLSETTDTDSLWENDVLSHPNINKWLHFNHLETDKLQWIKGINKSKAKSDEPYEARFDFSGYLLPYSLEYNEKTKPLFHHGEEPHRPGYSLTEIIELSRSAVAQQRVVALNIIAGILEHFSVGTYKNIIDIPITKLFFLIRMSMDENKVMILEPALRAMRNLLYNRIDEASLDALIGFKEGTILPCLENDKSEIEELESKETELKDFHLAEIDIIATLMRTDILQRLYYILERIKPSFNCVQYSLQIMIRLARDSIETASTIIQMDHLMNTITKHFIPSSSVNFLFDPSILYNGRPILAALKLIRVLSLTSYEVAEKLVSKYSILKPVSDYVSSGVDSAYGLRLQIEAYCILSNLLHFNLGLENVISLYPVISTTLHRHVQGTDIFVNSSVLSTTHAAVVLQLVDCLINSQENSFKEQIYPLLREGMQKWLGQLAQMQAYTCGHLRTICSILNCFTSVIIHENISLDALNAALLNLCKSEGFKVMMNNLRNSSNLLSGIEDTAVHRVKNLMSLGTCVIDTPQKVLPTLNVASPIPVLASLYELLYFTKDKDMSVLFLKHTLSYLKHFCNTELCLINNWFTRMEMDFLIDVLKLAIASDVSESYKDLVYMVANKLCFILKMDKQSELEFLFCNIIFNKEWFSAQRLFNLVTLSDGHTFLSHIDDISLCYSKVINIKCEGAKSNLTSYKKWKEPILPRDWIYIPILTLYSKSQETPAASVAGVHATKVEQQKAKDKEIIIRCSLEWILFNELCFSDILNDIAITDRFCRIMCVYLCDTSLFLDANIKNLLSKCTEILFKRGTQFDFDKPLEGLHNFQDFYTQFLEQFQSVSYGDPNFAACVLVPLAQRHNVKWRKHVWSEYAGCLRALDCPEALLCYELKDYFYPEETDESLLKSYHRALTNNLIRPNTIAYKIAQHHFECYKRRQSVIT